MKLPVTLKTPLMAGLFTFWAIIGGGETYGIYPLLYLPVLTAFGQKKLSLGEDKDRLSITHKIGWSEG